MFNRNSSAGTAVQKTSKSSLLARLPLLLAIPMLCAVYSCQAQKRYGGNFNVLIGKGAGKYLTTESYCVIVGHDSIAVNSRGKDMIWIVDWNEPYLCQNPDIKYILLDYYNSFVKTKKDNKDYRAGLALRIINRNNILIGKDAVRK